MTANLHVLLDLMRKATARIAPDYFQLPVAGSEEPIFRERVYCYELYHQLRLAMPDGWPYVLDGEVDKKAHPILREVQGTIPDFIVHVPGSMERNLAIIEVKALPVSRGDLARDLDKLCRFTETARYFAAIQLVYGRDDIARVVKQIAETAPNVLLLVHGAPETPCTLEWPTE